jgi:hypothetical protein
MTDKNKIVISRREKYWGWKIHFLATSIIQLENIAQKRTQRLATTIIFL